MTMISLPGINSSQMKEVDGIDLTALIDVIFTLLLFLILSMGATQVSTTIKLSKTPQAGPDGLRQRSPVIVEVSQTDSYWKIEDRTFADFGSFQAYFLQRFDGEFQRPLLLAVEGTVPTETLLQLLHFFAVHRFQNVQVISQWSQ